jgi:glucose-1-phosphate cytidylyltransferase
MKAVILAGGYGTRLSEETHLRPKPMVEIGGRPILWHIMKIYAHHGITDFIVCLGFKGYVIKEYFANYVLHHSNMTIDAKNGKIQYHQSSAEPWSVTLVDTGEDTQTGGRIKRVADFIGNDTFCMTYGDGVSNVDVKALIEFHKSQGRIGTLTAVAPPGRYGALAFDRNLITKFVEKPPGDNAFINGGFFVLEPDILERIMGDWISFESDILETLAADGQLAAYRHNGFWQPMDTLRDRNHLEQLWQSGEPPWKLWE